MSKQPALALVYLQGREHCTVPRRAWEAGGRRSAEYSAVPRLLGTWGLEQYGVSGDCAWATLVVMNCPSKLRTVGTNWESLDIAAASQERPTASSICCRWTLARWMGSSLRDRLCVLFVSLKGPKGLVGFCPGIVFRARRVLRPLISGVSRNQLGNSTYYMCLVKSTPAGDK